MIAGMGFQSGFVLGAVCASVVWLFFVAGLLDRIDRLEKPGQRARISDAPPPRFGDEL